MAKTVTEQSEILLNDYKYRIKGGVTGGWLDPFPEAFTLGDADYANRRDLSSWIMNDFRAGIGVEEMDEKKDANRCWWTNCIIQYRNHILPPRLATAIALPAISITNPDMELTTGWTGGSRSSTQAKHGTYSWKVTAANDEAHQSMTWADSLRSKTFTFGGWVWSDTAGSGNLRIDDGKTTSDSAQHTGGSGWEYLTVTKTLAADATELTLYFLNDTLSDEFYFDQVFIWPSQQASKSTVFANFNSELYMKMGKVLSKLNAARDNFDFIGGMVADITALIPSLNSRLYIYLGDTENYCYLGKPDLLTSNAASGQAHVIVTDASLFTAGNTVALLDDTPQEERLAISSILGNDITMTTNLLKSYTTANNATLRILTETAVDLKDLTADAGTDTDTIVDAALSGKSILKGDYVYNATRSAGALVTSYNDGTTTIELESTIASQSAGDTYSVRRGGNWGFQHDAKLFRANTEGTVTYSTDPDGAAPTWSSGGAITDIADQIEGFVVGRDAAGAYVPYAATNSIIKAYDSTTPQWIDTEARLPNHPIGGQGHAYWNGKLYFSYGLAVKEYYPETGAFLDIGLTERDGLPVEYNGEIVKLLGDTGVKGMFASIDASITSGDSKSGLYLYDGFGWQCWWADTPNNGAMHDIIVSSASSGYAVYWDVGGSIYYIDIPRGIENPDKISQSYATSGIFISPWFDAGNPVADKLAKALHSFAKGITTTETVALKYRTDHTCGDLDSDWTTMDTLNTDGENGDNEELFPVGASAGAGLSFDAIQFRLDFVTLGATAKPDIQSLVFYHKKRTGSEKLRVWNVTVICDNYALTTAKQKVANLKAAVISTTDVLFSYHPNDASTESYYVTVDCPEFNEQTGREYEANYKLRLTES